MKNKIKTIILILLIIVVAFVMIWFAYKIINSNNSSETNANVVNNVTNIKSSEEKNNIPENKEENKIENDEENKTKNENVNEEKSEENEKNNTTSNNLEKNNTVKIEGNTNEEKAINIVKKNWGNEEGVYFSTMGIDANGKYIISVNDSATSAVKAWCYVDVDKGQIEIK